MQQGTPCGEEGYCFNGSCTDRTVHCKIFGRGALSGPSHCYNNVNTKASDMDSVKNNLVCWLYSLYTAGCMLCGRLQCANVSFLPPLQEHVGFHQEHWACVLGWTNTVGKEQLIMAM